MFMRANCPPAYRDFVALSKDADPERVSNLPAIYRSLFLVRSNIRCADSKRS
jgi:hypothetical protein